MPRRSRQAHVEEAHSNHERWLITYADMITLLMVLFIVMFAISQVDQKRFEELKDGVAAGFGETSSPFQGQDSVMPAAGTQPFEPMKPDAQAVRPEQLRLDGPVTSDVQADPADTYRDARAEVARLEQLRRRLARVLEQHGFARDVAMSIDERGLSISLVSRHIVFHANLAQLSPRGARVLDVLAPVLRGLPNDIDVDGHTNQVKVKPKYYPTDWELSAARAVTVLRYLDEHGHVDPARLSAVAYGHEKPLVDPARPASQELNKRVDIVVLSGASEDTRKLFDTVLRAQERG